MASNKLEEIESRLARVEERCHLLTQALAAVLRQQPNQYRTEIITTALREAEAADKARLAGTAA